MDQLYAQVDKKKQKSKEKEVCPEESEAVYSVVNKPSPPSATNKVTATPGGNWLTGATTSD